MIKKLLLLATLVAGTLALVASPASAQYEPGPSATIDDTTVLAGQTVNIQGECFGDDVVDVTFDGVLIGSLPVDPSDGSFGGPVTIPEGTPPGTYTVEATCGDTVLFIEVTVLADDTAPAPLTPTTSTPLARTGSSVDGLVKVGGGLLVAGAGAVLLATKRRTARA